MTSGNGDHPASTTQSLSHQALLYHTDAEFLAGAVPFLQSGLAQGDQVLVVTSPATAESLHTALGEAAGGRVEFAEARDWCTAPSWTMMAYQHYVDTHRGSYHPRVRVLGEPVWNGRCAAELTELARYESLINIVFAEVPVSFLCAYDAQQLDQPILDQAWHTHPGLVTASGARASPDYLSPADYSAECDREPLGEPMRTLDEHPVTRDSLTSLRRAIHLEARRIGLGSERAEEFLMAVNEIASNALQHGGGSRHLRLWDEGRKLVCEVTNQEGHIDQPFPGHLPPETAPRGGRGLWMVRPLCEVVQIRSHQNGGCTVRVHVFLD